MIPTTKASRQTDTYAFFFPFFGPVLCTLYYRRIYTQLDHTTTEPAHHFFFFLSTPVLILKYLIFFESKKGAFGLLKNDDCNCVADSLKKTKRSGKGAWGPSKGLLF